MAHSPTPGFQLVIFDCDGVLVDSEPLGIRVMCDMVAELGLVMAFDETLAAFRGGRMADCVLEIERRLGRSLPGSFVPDLRARMADVFRRDLRAVDGVTAAVDALRVPVCVASSGPVEKIRLSLELTGLLPRFEGRIFSAYEVGVWKPNPGLFLHAARAMGVVPGACAVVEDSLPGVRAGVAAGMTVFAYAPHAGDAELLRDAGAAEVFASMRDLPALLGVG